MKRLILSSLFILSYFLGTSQFSVSAKYSINQYPEWEDFLISEELPTQVFDENRVEYGLSYWFRLKNKRVEFLPELSVQMPLSEGTASLNHSLTSFYLNLTTQFYTLDFEGDCNCPTWGKDGNFVSKGFFVGVSPGIGYHNLKISNSTSTSQQFLESSKINFRVGLVTGIDIGIAKWITITPMIQLNYAPKMEWKGFIPGFTNSMGETTIAQDISSKTFEIQPGLRLMFRPDYLFEQKRMFR